MKHARIIWLIALLAAFQLQALERVPNQLIFKTSETIAVSARSTGLKDFDSFLQSSQLKEISPVLNKAQNRFFVASFHQDIDWQNLENLHFSGIEYVQPNYLSKLFLQPNDSLYVEQLVNLENSLVPDAWDITVGNDQIIVAVVDSGINFDHPDLQSNIYYNPGEIPNDGIDNDGNGYIDDWRGWDFVHAPELSSIAIGDYLDRDNDPNDDLFHGTHVSGIIAADTNNQEGIAGISWNAKILPIRAGFATNIAGAGYLQDSDAAAGIIYAADMQADIINISWGDVNYSPIIADACDYALQRGSIIVAAAGNSSVSIDRQLMYPAKLASTIAVGAVDSNLQLASFSCYGPQMDIVAPGSSIISTYSGNHLYQTLSGTSMSAPFVAGCLALLLSFEPGLDFAEIKSRLATSAIDLGEKGFDVYYANGLIDAQALLINQNTANIEIEHPADFAGFSSSFPIIGSVSATAFSHYRVDYASEDEDGNLSWQPVNPQISYYYEPVESDVIANFVVNPNLADSTYLVKVEVFSYNNSYRTTFSVYIDQTPPVYLPEYSSWMQRYEAENNEYFINVIFDEAVFLQNTDDPQQYNLPIKANSNHVLKLYHDPVNLPIDLYAVNNVGLEIYVDNAFNFLRTYHSIDQNLYLQSTAGQQIYAFYKTYDFDDNGKHDFVGIVNEDGQNRLKIFEPNQTEIIEKFDFGVGYWPHDIGDSDGNGIEIITMNIDQPVIFAAENSDYPSIQYNLDYTAFGANFADYDGDGIDEIVLIRNETINGATKKVMSLIKRNGTDFNLEHTIVNPTEPSIWNVFSNRIVCGDLDGDQYPDLVASDLDGDVMIFENLTGEFELSWTAKLPLGNSYYLAMGDFTGDGQNELCAGGYNLDYSEPERSFSFFQFFKSVGNNDYEAIGYISFSEVANSNSITTADLDGDGTQEIIVGVPPNIYIIDYQEGEFIPIWQGNSFSNATNVVAAAPQTDSNDAYIICNQKIDSNIQSSLIRKNEVFTGPPTPSRFTVFPLDENSVQLNWLHSSTTSFNIYRKQNEIVELLASNWNAFEFVDTGLAAEDTLYYQVTAVDASYDPPESLPTVWKQAVPDIPSQITEVKMTSSNELKAIFSKPLSPAAVNRGNFWVTPEIGNPVSLNLLEQNTAVILRFSQNFLPDPGQYCLHFSLIGNTGVPATGSPAGFHFTEDIMPPEIVRTTILTEDQVSITFSEAMQVLQTEDLANYVFLPPANDSENFITAAIYEESDSCFVTLDFSYPFQISTQPYFIKLNGMQDLAGNELSSSQNKCHFSLTANSGFRNLKQLKVYPNPLDMSKSVFGKISFINLPQDMSGNVWIYDLSGNLIFNDEFGPFSHPAQSYSWNCRNRAGKRISSGIYYYILRMGKDARRGKIIVIN